MTELTLNIEPKEKPLQLVIDREWMDKIVSGEKTVEYREIKQYYTSRLKDKKTDEFRPFKTVVMRNGYQGKNLPLIECEVKSIYIGEGREDWGAVPGEKYYCIELGAVLRKENLN